MNNHSPIHSLPWCSLSISYSVQSIQICFTFSYAETISHYLSYLLPFSVPFPFLIFYYYKQNCKWYSRCEDNMDLYSGIMVFSAFLSILFPILKTLFTFLTTTADVFRARLYNDSKISFLNSNN